MRNTLSGPGDKPSGTSLHSGTIAQGGFSVNRPRAFFRLMWLNWANTKSFLCTVGPRSLLFAVPRDTIGT